MEYYEKACREWDMTETSIKNGVSVKRALKNGIPEYSGSCG